MNVIVSIDEWRVLKGHLPWVKVTDSDIDKQKHIFKLIFEYTIFMYIGIYIPKKIIKDKLCGKITVKMS